MTDAARQVLQEAIRLTPAEKAELIEELFHSFDPDTDRRTDTAWAQEAELRIDAYDGGRMSADSADAVLARIRRK